MFLHRTTDIAAKYQYITGFLITTILVGCSSPKAPRIQAQYEEWSPATTIHGVQATTAHYHLMLTVKDRELLAWLPAFLETAHTEYQRILPPQKERTEPLVVYLFETRREWERFTQAYSPTRAPTYMYIREGGYMDYPTATTVAYDLGRDRTLSLLAHEGWHQYVAGHFLTPLPAWLDEGLACQWEAFDLKGGIPVFTPHNNYFRRNNLRETGDWDAGVWIPLKHLLSMNAGQAILQTGQTTRSFYAQVWALALFLREASPKTYGDGFRKLMADAGTERIRIVIKAYQATHTESEGVSEGEIIFRHYITEDLDTFEHDYRNFSRKLVR